MHDGREAVLFPHGLILCNQIGLADSLTSSAQMHLPMPTERHFYL